MAARRKRASPKPPTKSRPAPREPARPARKSAGRKNAGRVRTAGRLDAGVRPDEVDVHVDVRPNTSDRYHGRTRIQLELDGPRRTIELHAVGLRVSRARAEIGGSVRHGGIEVRPERQTVRIRFDDPLPKGSVTLELSFAGRLRSDLCGLYGASVGERRFAFSQLAAVNARKFFPCFDEPSMKARFQLVVTSDAGESILSNSPVERIEALPDGSRRVSFARTPPISSYLVALAVGDLECSEATFAGSTEIRVWHVRGKQGLCAFALDVARETLQRLESYFDMPYPYAKLDLVAVPDFEFGAMENPGAVFFRETLLLLDPTTSTLAERKRAAEVICHELAHMWYGDLVTMEWWDDLWLNEAFATWMAFSIVDEWRPQWHMWQGFLHHRAAALELDALRHTHPIYTVVRSPEQAGENFDAITYEKGAAVLRMLERYLGAEVFRDGVRRYIRRHRESNAVAADLWRALSDASGESVGPIMRPWIEQEGYPVVRVRRVDVDGRAVLELRQERFLLRAGRTDRAAVKWPVPWMGRVSHFEQGHSHTIRHMLRRRRERIPAEGADLTFVYGNADEGSFLRPLHDDSDRADVFEDLLSLTAVERQGLCDHQWALVRAGLVPAASLMDLLARLGTEADPDVLATARRPLATLVQRLAADIGPEIEERLRAWIEVYYGGQVDALGWDPEPDEPDRTRLRRAEILAIVGGIGRATSVLEESDARCDQFLEDRRGLDPNLADVTVALAASRGGEALYERFVAAAQNAETPHEHRRFLYALADFRAAELVERTCKQLLASTIPSQDVAFVLQRLMANRDAREGTWRFAKRRWGALRKRMGANLATRFVEATPALGSAAYRREVAEFFREHPVPSGDRVLRQALERFDWYAEYRRRAGPELARYLSG